MSTDLIQKLRAIALRYPQLEEGAVCQRASFKSGGKAFLFVGSSEETCDVMVKLRDSLAEAAALAEREPERFRVGAHGWVTATFPCNRALPIALLEKWIDESFRLLAPKKLVATTTEPKKKARKS